MHKTAEKTFVHKLTVNQKIITNDLFGEFGQPIRNATFNPAIIFICQKDFTSSVAWLPDLVVPYTV